jgi:hypothetical protein
LRNASLYLQLEVVTWVNNNWESQWLSGTTAATAADVGRLEVQVGVRIRSNSKGLLAKQISA